MLFIAPQPIPGLFKTEQEIADMLQAKFEKEQARLIKVAAIEKARLIKRHRRHRRRLSKLA